MTAIEAASEQVEAGKACSKTALVRHGLASGRDRCQTGRPLGSQGGGVWVAALDKTAKFPAWASFFALLPNFSAPRPTIEQHGQLFGLMWPEIRDLAKNQQCPFSGLPTPCNACNVTSARELPCLPTNLQRN
jgi:hypothetical protein